MWITIDHYKISCVSRFWIEDAIQIPDGTLIDKGMDIREFDETWNLRPLEDRVLDRLVEVPRGKKVIDGRFVSMSQIEKYQNGVDLVPLGMILDGDNLRCMTLLERVDAGQISKETADAFSRDIEIAKLSSELNALDFASIRAIRAIDAGTATEEDHAKLAEIETQVQAKRGRREELLEGNVTA